MKILTKCTIVLTKCNSIWGRKPHLCGIILNTKVMNGYIIFIALAIVACLVAAIVGLYFYCRKIERRCNSCLVNTIRDQDRTMRQLERILLEKETFEKLITLIKNS